MTTSDMYQAAEARKEKRISLGAHYFKMILFKTRLSIGSRDRVGRQRSIDSFVSTHGKGAALCHVDITGQLTRTNIRNL